MSEHYQTAGWGGVPGECGVECACGTVFDNFDTIAEAAALLDDHIARSTAAATRLRPGILRVIAYARRLVLGLAVSHRAMTREEKALEAVRELCKAYTPEPPPIFRGPGLSEHGIGFNHGTRTLADAVLSTIDDALRGESSE